MFFFFSLFFFSGTRITGNFSSERSFNFLKLVSFLGGEGHPRNEVDISEINRSTFAKLVIKNQLGTKRWDRALGWHSWGYITRGQKRRDREHLDSAFRDTSLVNRSAGTDATVRTVGYWILVEPLDGFDRGGKHGIAPLGKSHRWDRGVGWSSWK